MILEERGRPLVRNRRRDKNGGVCLARPVRVVDMLSRCIRRHSTRDEKITATLHASSTSSGVEAKQSCPADLGLWGRQGPCRRRPRSAILFRSRARGCSEGISWQPTRAIVVGAGQLAMDLGVCETAQWCCCSSGDGGFSLELPAFLFATGWKTVDKRAWRGKRGADSAEQRSGPEGEEGRAPTWGWSTPRFPQALKSPVPPAWTWGGTSYRALLIVARTLITQPPWLFSTTTTPLFGRQKLELRHDKIAMLSRNPLDPLLHLPSPETCRNRPFSWPISSSGGVPARSIDRSGTAHVMDMMDAGQPDSTHAA